MHVYQNLQTEAVSILPKEYSKLGDLIGIDGSAMDTDRDKKLNKKPKESRF